MANEITTSANVTVSRGACSIVRGYSKIVDQATADMYSEILTVNGDVALSFGLVSNGYIWVQNISENGSTIQLGPEVTAAIHPVLELFPQEVAMFRLDPAITLRANGVFSTLYYVVLDD